MIATILQFKWTVSKGRDSYGYNICSLWVRGKKVSYCNGGGYDMAGTTLGMYIMAEYQDRLLKIKDRAHRIYNSNNLNDNPIDPSNNLYGMTLNIIKEKASVSLDGACGMSSMEKVMNAIGLTLQCESQNLYILTDKRGK